MVTNRMPAISEIIVSNRLSCSFSFVYIMFETFNRSYKTVWLVGKRLRADGDVAAELYTVVILG